MMKRKILLKILVILILCILILLTYINGNSSSCNKCVVNFKNQKISGVNIQNEISYDYKMSDLYDGIQKGDCLIKWDPNGGYYEN